MNKNIKPSSQRRSESFFALALMLRKIPTCVGMTMFVVLLSFPVQAQDKYGVCKLLPKHTPSSDVAYKAGVDVHGNAVVPADLNANATPMVETLDVIRVPLNVNLAQNVAALQADAIQLEAPLGMVDIYQDGRVLYNGQDWTAPVKTLCGQSHKIVTEEIVEVSMVEPTAPIAPEFNEAAAPPKIKEVEAPILPNNLAVTGKVEMPAVSAPIVEEVKLPKISQPAVPIKPLVGTPKGAKKMQSSDIITGQDHRDYNE